MRYLENLAKMWDDNSPLSDEFRITVSIVFRSLDEDEFNIWGSLTKKGQYVYSDKVYFNRLLKWLDERGF